jgi:tetratricopeptide (TPR) repeat protein
MISRKILFVATLLLVTPTFGSGQESPTQGQALERFEAGDLATAQAQFEEVLASDSANHEAHFYLGRIALQQERLDEAIDHLKEAVAIKEDSSIYRTWLGRAYLAKLQTVSFFEKGTLAGRALEQLEKAVKLDSTNVEARVSLAGYYANAPSIAGGSKKKAREQLEVVMQYEPVRGKAILASLLVKDEEYDRAIELLQECIAAEPDEVSHRYRLGMLYQQLQRYDETFEVFEEILRVDANDPGALYQLARTAVFAESNLDRGIECLQTYMTIPVKPGNPGYDAAHWRLGMLYEHRGDLAEARDEYKAALELEPEEEKYREALKALEGL